MATGVLVCCLLLFFFIDFYLFFVQLHFAFPRFTVVVVYIDGDISRPDLKEPFTVFMLNQCFSCLHKLLPVK